MVKWSLLLIILTLVFGFVPDNDASAQAGSVSYPQSINRTIKGTVSDQNNDPLPGVTIVAQIEKKGSISDANGSYTINISGNNEKLLFTFIGYKDVLVEAGNLLEINVTMYEDTLTLSEVVVVGYGNAVKKESLTAAISNINATKLEKSAATHVSSALAGKIAGINFRMTNGEPGKATNISIRNMGNALYIIDGVQSTESSFNNLDFNDIESISVLKDASAAIYGVQAGSGVVVVTTKSGKRNTKSQVDVNAYYGVQSWFRYPKPADVITYVSNYLMSDVITGTPNPKFSMADLEAYRNGTKSGFDWYDFVVREAAPQQYIKASVTGGSDQVNYYTSLGYLDQESVIQGYGGFKRFNAQLNVDAQVTKKLRFGARFNGRRELTQLPAVPGDDVWAALFAIWRNPPTSRPYANDNPLYPAITSNTMSSNFAILNYDISGYLKNDVRVGQLICNALYDITSDLKFKGQIGYYMGHSWSENQEYTYNLYSYDPTTDTYPIAYSLTNPFRQRIISTQQQITTQGQLMYDKKTGSHSISGVLVAESYDEDNPGFDTWSRPKANAISRIDFASLETYSDYGRREITRAGFASRLNYNYAEKYYVELAGRYDGSWRFAPGKRWGFFPSVSAGWRISEEAFWKTLSSLRYFNLLKIRGSYGILGDDNVIDPFMYLTGYTYGTGGAALDGKYYSGAISRGLPVTSISWIDIKMLDVGIDFGLFGNRLNSSIDYFRRKGDGIAASRYDVLIPSEVGFILPKENLESDIHTGLDGSIIWNDKIGNLSYSIGATFTLARYYTWHQYKPRYGNSIDEYRNSDWERFGNTTWGYISEGQFQSWDEIQNYSIDIDGKGNSTLRPGDIKYKDLNGDGVINNLDERPIGYSEGIPPNLNFGLNGTGAYKGFDLAFDFSGGALGTYHINYEVRNPFWDGGNTAAFILEDQWRLSDITNPESELIKGKYPTAIAGNSSHSNYWPSDFWYRNVWYVKLRNFELGYTLPGKWASKVNLEKLRIYVMGQNLFSIDNMGEYEIDPEIANESALAYPTSRILITGLKLTF